MNDYTCNILTQVLGPTFPILQVLQNYTLYQPMIDGGIIFKAKHIR